ncbi:terminase family protein [Pedobacter antarcticus]|uniref:terminase family protein n=1 Tax=Pedobacter antarcticus TaxID=34086 RepID=UPI001C55B49F|nr:terminase family protein [Pedobacter antarcticus]
MSFSFEADEDILPEEITLFESFPKQDEFITAIQSGEFSFVLFGGAIRGGKTFVLLAMFCLLCKVFPGSRWALVRKNLPTIKKNLYPSWNKIKPETFIDKMNNETHTVTFKNKSQIIFFPENYAQDKNLDRWKGLEVNGFGFEEINECQQVSFYKAFERAGSYIVPGLNVQPKPIVVATCNPTQGWVKSLVYTPWKNGTLKKTWKYIQSRIHDNLPLLAAQPDYLPSLRENLNHYEYEVYVEGNWDVQLKTGGEFLRRFELSEHVMPLDYDIKNMFHISLDSNVYPHIAVTVWQLVKKGSGWIIRQVHELPAADPINTGTKAGKNVGEWLKSVDYKQRVKIYGDRSTKNRNNIDDNKKSFFQLFTEGISNEGFIIEDCMLKGAPVVSTIADFVNSIFAGEIPGLSIEIAEHCRESINDYIETKTDKDGSMLKVRVKHPTIEGLSYEKNGHLTDTLKDFIVSAFNKEYLQFINKKKALGIRALSGI